MVLPLYPNPISSSQIRDEFGQRAGTGVISLSDYHANAFLVRPGTNGFPNNVSTPIPSSGPIALSNFFGAKKTTVINDFAQYSAAISYNVGVYNRCDSGSMYITTATQQYPLRPGQTNEDGQMITPPMYGGAAATSRIAWRTAGLTQADYNQLTLMVGESAPGRGWVGPMPPQQSIKALFNYSDFIPASEGDILYYHYGVKSDDIGYIGFNIYDLETRTWAQRSIVGGDMNSADGGDTKCWSYVGAGLRNLSGALDSKLFSGKKLILPFWRIIQVGSRSKYFSQEFYFAHARNTFGGQSVNGRAAFGDRGAGFQRLFVPNPNGLASPYPEIFNIVGNTMTLKADIVVTTHVTASSANGYGFAPEKNREAFLFPPNLPIYKYYNQERFSDYIPYVFRAGVYQLDPTVLPLYNPTIYVI